MRISELSDRSGVSAASIKYYVREGLLPAPERVGYNQSEYDEAHADRLRLIRVLLESGGVSVDAARRVIAAVDDEAMPLEHLMATAQSAIPTPEAPPSAAALETLGAVAQRLGWLVGDDNPGLRIAARVLESYASLGIAELQTLLEPYARAADIAARAEVALTRATTDRARAATIVAVGTVLGDSLMAGLRRMAQESATRTADPVQE